jgi:alkylation response protein AidB-like acyl-CoA dehydrogenase
MNFGLTDEQGFLQKTARDFLETECPKSLVREIQASDLGYSPEIWSQMAELGWLGIVIPEEYGGAGRGLVDLAVLMEEIGRAAFPSPLFSTLVLGALPILEAGSEQQKKRLLPAAARGEAILTLAMAEPHADHLPQFLETRARTVNGGFAISGTKLFVENAHIADPLLVVGKTKEVDTAGDGISVFLVEAGAPGLEIDELHTLAEGRQCEVVLTDVSVTADRLLGRKDGAWPVVHRTLQTATALQCVEAVGVMEQMLAMAVSYVKTRRQFDRPIGSFQAVQHRLADIFTCVNAARWNSYQAVWRLEKGLPAEREVAMAKAWICDKISHQVTFGVQQVFGGIGLDLEHDLHFYFNRARELELSYGAAPVHRRTIEAQLGI